MGGHPREMNIEIIYNAHQYLMFEKSLHPSTSPGAEATYSPTTRGCLRLPPGPANPYRLAQWDDYHNLARTKFSWRPPVTFSLRARSSHMNIPGTWGFGLWNDPMSLSLGFGSVRKLPALPNTAWFFFASPENCLSLRDDLPANGALAATFRAPNIPTLLLAPGAVFAPLFFIRPIARFFRWIASQIIRQDAVSHALDPTEWHDYKFRWEANQVTFFVDNQVVLTTTISPRGPLGLVIWVDNQFAAWRPDGVMKWGLLEGKEVWVEVEALNIA